MGPVDSFCQSDQRRRVPNPVGDYRAKFGKRFRPIPCTNKATSTGLNRSKNLAVKYLAIVGKIVPETPYGGGKKIQFRYY